MFTMAKIKDGASYLGRHLCANDYYSEHETVIGKWFGKGAEKLRLSYEIRADDSSFENLRCNRLPDGAGKLTARDGDGRVRFYDFQCSAPKSVSILAVTLSDKRLMEAHDQSAEIAFGELEKFAACQRNSKIQRVNHTTGNIIAAAFGHNASRALDPQVHTHFVTANATWDESTKTWKALTEFEMLQAVRYAGKVYQNELGKRCLALGYSITEARDDKGTVTGFEISGVSKVIMERFSKRRAEIEEGMAAFERKHGRTPTTREIHVITKETRNPKLKEITTPEVLSAQRGQLSPKEFADLERLKMTAQESVNGLKIAGRERECLRMAVAHLFERRSVVEGHEILAEALNQGMGVLDLRKLHVKLKELSLVSLTEDTPTLGTLYATQRGLKLEKWAVAFVNDGVGKFAPLARVEGLSGTLSSEQRVALSAVLSSGDHVSCLRGAAGVGKTTILKEMDRVLIASGTNCWYCAPTSSAADTLRKEGLAQSTTVADFLLNVAPRQSDRLKGAVIVVDEAGLTSNRQGAELLRLAGNYHARVLFIGDSKQHSAVEAGDFLRMLEGHSKMFRAEITSVRRQTVAEYRDAVQMMAVGAVRAGLEKLDGLGWVKEGRADYLEAAAKDFLRLYGGGEKPNVVLAVTPSWAENHALTDVIRQGLKERGLLGSSQKITVHESLQWTAAQKSSVRNYESGMVVVFNRSVPGFQRGQVGEVVRVTKTEPVLKSLDGKERKLPASPDSFDVTQKRVIEVAVGDCILIRANDRRQHLINGEVITLAKIEADKLHTTDGRTIDLQQFKRLSHGYAVTSHKSQSKTVDHVVVAASQLDAKAAYVACSRGRLNCALHTPDKAALLTKLPEGNRMAALDLLSQRELQQTARHASFDRMRLWPGIIQNRTLAVAIPIQQIAARLWMKGITGLTEIVRSCLKEPLALQVNRTSHTDEHGR